MGVKVALVQFTVSVNRLSGVKTLQRLRGWTSTFEYQIMAVPPAPDMGEAQRPLCRLSPSPLGSQRLSSVCQSIPNSARRYGLLKARAAIASRTICGVKSATFPACP